MQSVMNMEFARATPLGETQVKLEALTSTAVFSALLYVIGMRYLAGYYAFFNIGLNEISVSLETILASSISSVFRAPYLYPLLSFAFAFSAFLFFCGVMSYDKTERVKVYTFFGKFFVFIVVIIGCFMVLISSHVGASVANENLRRLEVARLDESMALKVGSVLGDEAFRRWRLLTADENQMILIGTFPRSDDFWTLRLTWDGEFLLVYSD
jgi:hypothetical protein